jgi:hypothetical protein
MILGNHGYNVYDVNKKKNERGSVWMEGWEDIG